MPTTEPAAHPEGGESLGARALLGCTGAAMLGIPIWLLLSAALIQLDPALNGFQAILEGADTPMSAYTPLELWIVGGARAAILMTLSLPLVGVAWLAARGTALVRARRELRERERYDAMVRDAAVLRDVDWTDDRDGI